MLATIYLLQVLLLSPYNLLSCLPCNTAQSTARPVPTVSLCALLGKPAEYDGKEIRVRATYHIGFEHSYFDDPSCKEYAVETTPYWTGDVVWASFNRQSVEASTERNVYEEFNRVARPCCPPDWHDTEVELTVVGIFSMARDKVGYGHSERYALQLLVGKIEKVSNKTAAGPSPTPQ